MANSYSLVGNRNISSIRSIVGLADWASTSVGKWSQVDEMLGQQEARVNSTSAAPPCWVEDHHRYVPLVRFFFP